MKTIKNMVNSIRQLIDYMLQFLNIRVMRVKGTVKFYNPSKGFGFIINDLGEDVFVHVSELGETGDLKQDEVVSFVVEATDRGMKATNVQR